MAHYTTEQVAARLGMTARYWRLHAEALGVQRVGHALVWTDADLEAARAYLERRIEERGGRAGPKPRKKKRKRRVTRAANPRK